MRRNLDLTAVRSFVAVADSGGVTRAAGLLNVTQSAVSMQLKRLEEALGTELLDRSQRQIRLTSSGEQLLSYARRILTLNDEVVGRMTDPGHEGEIVLGVPHDIVYPVIPSVLKRFHAEFPKMRVNLLSSYTEELLGLYARGNAQVILTTEGVPRPGGHTLVDLPLIWIGAPNGRAWTERPLRLAFETRCIFRATVQAALDGAEIPWEMAVESESTRTVEASVSADLAVHACLEGVSPAYMAPVEHSGDLPELGSMKINMYRAENGGTGPHAHPISHLCDMLETGFRTSLGHDHDLPRRSTAA